MSKRVGAVPEETKAWILSAAGEEFGARGFAGASLRRICASAGVTTGALYFFFKGKDDLFASVIAQVTEPFSRLMEAHYRQERDSASRHAREGLEGDFEISRLLIGLYFENRQSWDILVHNLSHPAVRAFLDRFTEASTEHYLYLIQAGGAHAPDRFAVHQFVHMQTDTMLNLISHDFGRQDMLRHARTATRMLRGAFCALLAEED